MGWFGLFVLGWFAGRKILAEAMQQSVPSYRQQHVKTNVEALRAGFDLAPRGAAPAWEASG